MVTRVGRLTTPSTWEFLDSALKTELMIEDSRDRLSAEEVLRTVGQYLLVLGSRTENLAPEVAEKYPRILRNFFGDLPQDMLFSVSKQLHSQVASLPPEVFTAVEPHLLR